MDELKKPILSENLFDYHFISSITAGPSLACTVSKMDADNNNYQSNIYLLRNTDFIQLSGMNQERTFVFDGDDILFAANRDHEDKKKKEDKEEYTAFYRLSTQGGEARKAFSVPLNVNEIIPAKDGLYIMTASIDANHPDYYAMDKEARKAVLMQRKEDMDYEVLDEIPFWANGGGFTNKKRSRLFLYDAKQDKLEPITTALFDCSAVRYHRESNELVYSGAEVTTKPQRHENIYRYQLDGKKNECLYDKQEYSIRGLEWFNQGLLITASRQERYGNNENNWFYWMNLNTKEITLLAEYEDSIGSSVGSDCRYGAGKSGKVDKDVYYFITTVRNRSCIYSLDKEGIITPIVSAEGSVDCLDIIDNKLVYAAMRDMKLQEIYEYDLDQKIETQLSHFNEEVMKEKYVAMPRKLTVNSDGIDIDGWVLEPYQYQKGKSYPAILDIHGGPKTVYGEVFYHEMQMWAAKGYFVYFLNPQGSDGRGNEFADIRGKYGTIDYNDIMNFTDEVLKLYPDIDTKRLGVTGGSYGGFMTNWIIGHTDRFASAASQRSISNWLSFYGVSDIGFRFGPDQQAATIYDNPEKLWWHSPLKYADKAVTPTLFIHSDEDYRCPMPEGLQMYTALVDKGVEARLCWFKGENHELSRSGKPLHRQRRLKEITNWMESHLK